MSQSDITSSFEQACYYGYINVAQWLYQIAPQIITSQDEYSFDELYLNACILRGHLEIGRLLLQIDPNIDVLGERMMGDKHTLFSKACANGHLDVAQWLFQLDPEIIISPKFPETLIETCRNGHLDVVQWLMQIKPDVDLVTYGERLLKAACSGGHLHP